MLEDHLTTKRIKTPERVDSLVSITDNRPSHEPGLTVLQPLNSRRRHGLDGEIRLRDLSALFVRRRTVMFTTLLTCLIVGALICIFWTRRYMATAEMQVGKETDNTLGLQTEGGQEPPTDSLAENVTIQTQAGILQSDTLALRVINDLNLESTRDFSPKFSPIGYVTGMFAPHGPPDPKGATLEESPQRRAHALEIFARNLDVKPVPGTRLITISYLDPNPKLAAEIVNHLSNSLVEYNFQIRHDANSHTAEWLAAQMSDLRKQSEDLQAKVATLQRESGVFSLGETDATGREQVYSSVLDKLQQSTTALSQAQANRIGKDAIYRVVQSGDPEAISQISGVSIFASSSGLDSSLSLIQSMRMQEATQRGQLAEMTAKFGPAYPKLDEMRGNLEALDGSIHAEVSRVAERAKNDSNVAHKVEENARKIYIEQKHQADRVNDKTIEYVIARQEAEESRNLYESLFKQLKQSGVLAGFRANNISLVDPARIPARPARPKVLLCMTASLIAGVVFGAGAAILKEGVDTRFHDLTALEFDLGQVPLATLPYYKKTLSPRVRNRRKLMDFTAPSLRPGGKSNIFDGQPEPQLGITAIEDPHSPFVEALRSLRTSLLLSKARGAPKVILITSSMPGEGKSMLSANLATILAGQKRRVLLVDADLRHPSLHHSFNLAAEDGLSGLLSWEENEAGDQQAFETAAGKAPVPVSDVPGLYIVPSGYTSDCPAELLSSGRMSQAIRVWRGHFDYIIIDGSPVLPVTDAVLLSSTVDFTLLVARHQVIDQQALLRAYCILRSQVNNDIGVVVNAVRETARIYYPPYQYGHLTSVSNGVPHEDT